MNIDLRHGDCLELMKDIPDESIDLVLTDPPYGTTNCSWDNIIPFDKMWEQLNRIVKPGGAILLFSAQPFTSELIHNNIKNYKHYWIWNKELCGAFALAKKRPLIVTEEICVFSRDGKSVRYYPIMEDKAIKNLRSVNTGSKSSEAVFGTQKAKSSDTYNPKKHYPTNIRTYSKFFKECNNRNRVHPTQKPVDLLKYFIETYSLESETVLDFTMGSGSTGVACINTNRNFIGIELDDKYFEIAKNRIEAAQSQLNK